MDRYTLYCTEGQTLSAYINGAPLEVHFGIPTEDSSKVAVLDGNHYLYRPTAEQMQFWLMDKLKISCWVIKTYTVTDLYGCLVIGEDFVLDIDKLRDAKTYKEAVLATIEEVTSYLKK